MKLKCSKNRYSNTVLQYILIFLFLLACTLMASISTSLLIKNKYKENFTAQIENDIHDRITKTVNNLESSLDHVLTLSSHALYNSLYEVRVETNINNPGSNAFPSGSMNSNNYLIYTSIRNICKASNLIESVYFYDKASGYVIDSEANICHIDSYFDTEIKKLFQYNTDTYSNPLDKVGCYFRVLSKSLFDNRYKKLMTVIYSYKNIRHIAVNVDLQKYYKLSYEELNSTINTDLIFSDKDNKIIISTLDGKLLQNIKNIDFSNHSSTFNKIEMENVGLLKVTVLKSQKYDFNLYGVIKQNVIDEIIAGSLNEIIMLQFIMFFIYTNFFMLFTILFLRPIVKSIKAILGQESDFNETIENEIMKNITYHIPDNAYASTHVNNSNNISNNISKKLQKYDEYGIEKSSFKSVLSIHELLNIIYYRNMKINRDLKRFLPAYASMLLLNILTGKIDDIEQMLQDLNNYGFILPLKGDYYTAAIEVNIMKNEDYNDSFESISTYKQFLVRRCNELFNDSKLFGFAVDFNENIIGLVYSNIHGKDCFLDFLSTVNESLLAKFEILASISIGPKVENIFALSTSFYKALNALNYRVTFDKEEIIDEERIHIRDNLLMKYYYSIKEQLMRFIEEGNAEKTCSVIDELFNYIKKKDSA